MRLIRTSQPWAANSFAYLVERQRLAQELAALPTGWIPWNDRETLEPTVNLPGPGTSRPGVFIIS